MYQKQTMMAIKLSYSMKITLSGYFMALPQFTFFLLCHGFVYYTPKDLLIEISRLFAGFYLKNYREL